MSDGSPVTPRRWWPALRVTVSLTLAAILILRVPRDELSAAGSSLGVGSGLWLVAALMATLLAAVLAAARWQAVLDGLGRKAPLSRLLGHTLAGQLVGNVLPSSIGGDALRVQRLGRDSDHAPSAFASVVLERLSGWIVLPVLTLTALVINPGLLEFGPTTFALTLALCVLGVWILLVGVAMSEWAGRLGRDDGWRRFLSALHGGLVDLRRRPQQLLRIMGFGVAYQLTLVLAAVLLANGLGIGTSPTALLAFLPMVLIMQLLPVAIGGLGVRESALVLFFSPLGVPAGDAILLGLMIYGATLLVSLLGVPSLAAGSSRSDASLPVP